MKKTWILAMCLLALLGTPATAQNPVNAQTVVTTKKIGWKEVCEQTLEIIRKEGGLDPKELSLKGNIKTDYGLDSLDLVEIITECERRFNIRIDDASIDTDEIYKVEYLVHVIYFEIPHKKVRDCFDPNSWKKQDACSEVKKK